MEGRVTAPLLLLTLICLTPGSCGDTEGTVGGTEGSAGRRRIVIAGLVPNNTVSGRGILPAVQLALQHINNDNNHILPNHEIDILWQDSKCDVAVATKAFFDTVHDNPATLLVFGAACDNVTMPLAEAITYWNLVQLSYAARISLLSNRETYKTFFRTIPSDKEFNPARAMLLRNFNWTRVGTVTHIDPKHSWTHNNLRDVLVAAGIKCHVSKTFDSNVSEVIHSLLKEDIRIILGNFDELVARRLFCTAYKMDFYGVHYQWIIPGWFEEGWWKVNHRNDPDVTCTDDEMFKSVNGYISVDVLPLSNKMVATVSGRLPLVYQQEYESRIGDDYSKYHAYAYDGVWAMALALHNVVETLISQRDMPTDLDLGLLDKADLLELLMGAMNSTNFEGVTGTVRFGTAGQRLGSIMFEQFQEGKEVKVAEYDAVTNHLELDVDSFHWQVEHPPLDTAIKKEVRRVVSLPLYAVMCAMASVGIILATSFLFFNIKHRSHRYIKMSSPNLNNFIIVGCIFIYTSVFLLGLDGGMVSEYGYAVVCVVRTWLLCVGFTLAFGAMFSKTWRVHVIFRNLKMKKKVIKDSKLIGIVCVFLLIDMIILIIWQVIDPMEMESVYLHDEKHNYGQDMTVIPYIEQCRSPQMHIWMVSIYVYKGLLSAYGGFLAWETRHVTIPALNDSKYIGMSVYNVLIICMMGAAVSFIVERQVDALFAIMGISIIFCTTLTLCLVFVPKLIEFKRNPKGPSGKFRYTTGRNAELKRKAEREASTASVNDIHTQIKTLERDNEHLKDVLMEKEGEVEALKTRLAEFDNLEMEEHSAETDALIGRTFSDENYSITNSNDIFGAFSNSSSFHDYDHPDILERISGLSDINYKLQTLAEEADVNDSSYDSFTTSSAEPSSLGDSHEFRSKLLVQPTLCLTPILSNSLVSIVSADRTPDEVIPDTGYGDSIHYSNSESSSRRQSEYSPNRDVDARNCSLISQFDQDQVGWSDRRSSLNPNAAAIPRTLQRMNSGGSDSTLVTDHSDARSPLHPLSKVTNLEELANYSSSEFQGSDEHVELIAKTNRL